MLHYKKINRRSYAKLKDVFKYSAKFIGKNTDVKLCIPSYEEMRRLDIKYAILFNTQNEYKRCDKLYKIGDKVDLSDIEYVFKIVLRAEDHFVVVHYKKVE